MIQVKFVDRRNVAHDEPELGMRCDRNEMPHPTEGSADRYFVGVGRATSGESVAVGLFAAALRQGRLLIIVAPPDPRSPACWVAAQVAELQVSTDGTSGMFKKRPVVVVIEGDTVALALGDIAQFHPARRVLQGKRSAEMVAALRGPLDGSGSDERTRNGHSA